jgi:transcriptional regulator with XRE-family HTH domain
MKKIDNHPAIKFGKFMQQIRRKRGLTVREFAEFLNYNLSTYFDFEVGLLKNLGQTDFNYVCLKLNLNKKDLIRLKNLYKKTLTESYLRFSDIFGREDLIFSVKKPKPDKAFIHD